ncbi:GGDEF domain-containing protein [uncultured Thiodictyon sp.]|uniref:GGDEF domain-containing protein n=1 Tax=uncultured Thiodictyon sp. TaxID=1846217 RepID=UPI0025F0E03A|nr:GGDEF domain-containing protein [uncultured Thiodictyon sp.]
MTGVFHSLTGRLFKRVFGGYVVLAIVVTGIQLALEYRSIQQTIAHDLASLAQSFNGGVTGALWELDGALVQTMAQGIAQSSIVTGVRVASADGEVTVAIGAIPPLISANVGGLLAPFQFDARPLIKSTPTGTRQLGELTIYADRSVAIARIKYSFLVILTNSIIKTAGLWVIFHLVISRSLARPLSQLTQFVSRLEFAAQSHEPMTWDYPHRDEWWRLLRAMRKMQERMYAAREELAQMNSGLEVMVKARTQQLAEALDFSETILLNSPIPMGVYAAGGHCVLVNEAYAGFVGATREALLAQQFHTILAWQQSTLLGDCLTALRLQVPRQGEVNTLTSFGKEVSFEYRILPTQLKGDDYLLVQFFDLTARKRMEEELRHLAFHDSLTRLPNRRLLLDRLERALRIGQRQLSHLAVLFLDLNRFKQLNDTHGHDVGDQLLVEVAQRLRQAVRDGDTVARLGGDEFVVLLEGLAKDLGRATVQATAIAEQIEAALCAEYLLGSVRHQGSASIGITLLRGQDLDPDQVLKDADAAMYKAKRRGRVAVAQ